MSYYIIKRDGVRQPFDPEKIKNAVIKAFTAVDGDISDYALEKAQNIADYIEGYMEGAPNELTIDDIQSLVEHGLMATKRKDVATAYIEYRHDRDNTRKWNNHMMEVIKEKLQASNVQNQNANVDEHSFGGRKGEADSVLMKEFALYNCMSEKSRQRHLNNEIYIHDLDSYAVGMHNCLSIPFDDLLAKGFNTRQTDVRPANSINTAFQLVAVIFQLQSLQQFGGVAATHLDWTMVPYVRKSLFKHYLLEYLKDRNDFYELNLEEMSEEELDDWVEKNKKHYLLKFNLKEEDFYIGANIHLLDKRYYKYYKKALFETRRELKQAVEGMYHNLR